MKKIAKNAKTMRILGSGMELHLRGKRECDEDFAPDALTPAVSFRLSLRQEGKTVEKFRLNTFQVSFGDEELGCFDADDAVCACDCESALLGEVAYQLFGGNTRVSRPAFEVASFLIPDGLDCIAKYPEIAGEVVDAVLELQNTLLPSFPVRYFVWYYGVGVSNFGIVKALKAAGIPYFHCHAPLVSAADSGDAICIYDIHAKTDPLAAQFLMDIDPEPEPAEIGEEDEEY